MVNLSDPRSLDRKVGLLGLPCDRGGDARRQIWIKPQKVTNLGVAQALFVP